MATWPPSSAPRRPPPHSRSRCCRVRGGRRGRRLRWPAGILVSSQLRGGESSEEETHPGRRPLRPPPYPTHSMEGQPHGGLTGLVRLAVIQASFHQPLLDRTGAHWLDDPPDVSCLDSTCQYAVDDPLLSCKQQGRIGSGVWPMLGGSALRTDRRRKQIRPRSRAALAPVRWRRRRPAPRPGPADRTAARLGQAGQSPCPPPRPDPAPGTQRRAARTVAAGAGGSRPRTTQEIAAASSPCAPLSASARGSPATTRTGGLPARRPILAPSGKWP
jgi:hypothetical protein